jgi:hypothetical protein
VILDPTPGSATNINTSPYKAELKKKIVVKSTDTGKKNKLSSLSEKCCKQQKENS